MVVTIQHSLLTRWASIKTLLVTTLLGWIPLPLGQLLRNVLYRFIFKTIGYPVWIRPNVEITNAHWIEIADRVTINRGVCIDVPMMNEVYLGPRVLLDRDVRITCRGEGGKLHLREKVTLDRGVDIKVHHGGQTEIGCNTYVGPYTCISGYGDIKIGSDCLIASHSAIYAHNHGFADPTRKIREQGFTVKGIVIEDNCWLGTNVKVVDGVTIGRGSVIGAGAVVTRSIPPYSIAVGVPAKVIAKRQSDEVLQSLPEAAQGGLQKG